MAKNCWAMMKQRCDNPKAHRFSEWGGRGISYDPRWASYEAFLEDMGPRPNGTSLDRIDNDKGYSKENCRWATNFEQSQNIRMHCDNKLGEKNISHGGSGFRVSFMRFGKHVRSKVIDNLADAIELRNLALDSLKGIS